MPTKLEIKNFSEMIQNLAKTKNIPIMDAICLYCEESGFEIELSATLLTPLLKSLVKEEAEELNLLKKTSKLPV